MNVEHNVISRKSASKRAWEVLKEKGFLHLIRTSVNWFFLSFRLSLFKLVDSEPEFILGNRSYKYFYHPYNETWKNERTVEIPIVYEFVREYRGKEILEVGNTMSHYFVVNHDVLDKYERDVDVINEDIVDFNPSRKYDLIVSVSTLEHVGWNETPKDPYKVLKALQSMEKLLAIGGKAVVTFGIGQNPVLDQLLRENKLRFTELRCLKRISRSNKWREVSWPEIAHAEYDRPFPKSNGLVVGIVKK